MNLSPHFTLEEFIHSEIAERKGLDNCPLTDDVENMKALCVNVLEPLREAFKQERPNTFLVISSGFRSPAVNKAIGGAPNSQHQFGQAADIYMKGVPHEAVFNWLKNNTPYDQAIREFPPGGWVHVSYVGKNPRKNALVATRRNGKTVYLPHSEDMAVVS